MARHKTVRIKFKSHRGAKKRFKITARGRVKRTQNNLSHILTSKKRSRKRRLRRLALVSRADERRIKAMMPYG